ncbi:MAG: hypothetical protein ACREVJ_10255, partial [Gammaproteobacteria bacterium]
GCSAPEALAPKRPALRFAHNLWPGDFPITLARELKPRAGGDLGNHGGAYDGGDASRGRRGGDVRGRSRARVYESRP